MYAIVFIDYLKLLSRVNDYVQMYINADLIFNFILTHRRVFWILLWSKKNSGIAIQIGYTV